MRSNTGSPRFVGKTNRLCQSPSFLDREDRGLWVRDCVTTCWNKLQHACWTNQLATSLGLLTTCNRLVVTSCSKPCEYILISACYKMSTDLLQLGPFWLCIFIYSCSTRLISIEINLKKLISKEINRAEHEYMNILPIWLVMALNRTAGMQICVLE